MQNTKAIYEDRKKEIEFYYSIMLELSIGKPTIQTIDNSRFFKILKSNFLLMLYNIVEACTISGFLEIYDMLKSEACTYIDVIDEISAIWVHTQIEQIYGPTTLQSTYEARVQRIINNITEKNPIELTRDSLKVSGNLDAKKIKFLCDKHGIRYKIKGNGESLYLVKEKRNSLGHGDVSFTECARDITISDLDTIKDEVLSFLRDILDGMQDYCENKGYRKFKSI